ncbi:hypothetical protein CTM83_01900 [Photobacterium leiognathi subsp. mandapamensis]|nr:hypothetical protein CTM83_01900 [Photobacterium leiognathi subsp. mandapamensis]
MFELRTLVLSITQKIRVKVIPTTLALIRVLILVFITEPIMVLVAIHQLALLREPIAVMALMVKLMLAFKTELTTLLIIFLNLAS